MHLVWRNQVELDAVGKAQRKVIGEFKERLARIIEKNETLPELEKMERSEFVVDVAGRYLAAESRRNTSTRLLLAPTARALLTPSRMLYRWSHDRR